ncbi:hypothetical protein OEZ86_005786 [Tetradesmus obliquus]|nr:hypothetical protein OEZ86_005786 [Tetradesmus obliquus]
MAIQLFVVTFTVRSGSTTVATVSCVTDATGACRATIPASSVPADYTVVASAACGDTPVTSPQAPASWLAVPGQLLLNVPVPTLPVQQPGALEAQLYCGGIMTPGATVTFQLANAAGAVAATYTAVTDANGLARATVPAEVAAKKYNVTATASPACSSTTGSVPATPKPGSGTTIEWIAQPDVLTISASPGARVPAGTTITVTGRLLSGSTPVPGKVVTFNGVQPDGTRISVQCTTQADGSCSVSFVRPTPDEVLVTAAANGSFNSPVSTAAPTKLEWFAETPDQLLLSAAPDRRVPAGTTVTVSANFTEGGKPAANKEVTFSIELSNKTIDTQRATTDSNGVATISLVRPTPDEATVTAVAGSTAGRNVTSTTPAQIVWFSTEPDQLVLDIDHGVRVLTNTKVPITATYTEAAASVITAEQGKPVAGKAVTFTVRNPDGTLETISATTDAAGKAVIELVRADPSEVKLVASTTSRNNTAVTSGAEAHVIWYTEVPDALVLSMNPGARVPVGTTVEIRANYSEAGKPVANKPITFTLTSPGRGSVDIVVNTDSQGIARLTQKRDSPEEATVTARTTSSKTNQAVDSGAPSKVEWFATAPEWALDLTLSPSARVPVTTGVQVSATYAEQGKPVAGRTVTFNVRYDDGTTASPTAVTDARGVATVTLNRATPSVATVTATATTSTGQTRPVTTNSNLEITWFGTPTPPPPAGPEQLVLSVIQPLVNVGETADVQAFYKVGDKPVPGATVTFQLRNPTTNAPVGNPYTAKTGPDGVARLTIPASDVALVRRVLATTPSASGSGTVTGLLDPLSSPTVTWVSQKLQIWPTPNARVASGDTITVIAQYLENGEPVPNRRVTLTAANSDKTTDTITLTTDSDGKVYWPRNMTVRGAATDASCVVRARTTSSTNSGVVSTSVGEGRSADGSSTTLMWFKQDTDVLALNIPDPVVAPGKPVTVEACYTVDGKPQAGQTVEFTLIDPVTRAPTGAVYTALTGADCKATVQIPAVLAEDAKLVSARLVKSNKLITGTFLAQSSDTIQWSQHQLKLGLTPSARVKVATRVRVSATYVVGSTRQANQPVTFSITYSDGTKATRVANTNARGIASINLVRNTASIADVVATTTPAGGKTISSVSMGAGSTASASKSVIEWYSDNATEQPLLQLTAAPGARVPVGTTITVSAAYTEGGKPVAGKRIVFTAVFRNGTRRELSGTTNAAGLATASFTSDAAVIADVTATTAATTGQAVSSAASVIEWVSGAAPPGDGSGLCMTFLLGKAIPMSVLSCSRIMKDGADAQLAAAISEDAVKQAAALGDSSLTVQNVRVNITSCVDQPNQVAITYCVDFVGASPVFSQKTRPRLTKLLLDKLNGQSLDDSCAVLPGTCKTITGNYASLLGSCASLRAQRNAANTGCKVGTFTAGKMCPMGLADAKPSPSTRNNLWAGTYLPQPGGSCTVMGCNVEAGANCFPLSLDLLRPPATSKTPQAAVAATVTVSCVSGKLVGDFKAADGYALTSARIQSTCGQTWQDTPRYCPARRRRAAAAAAVAAAEFPPLATTARVVSSGVQGCYCPSGCAPFVWVDADVSARC